MNTAQAVLTYTASMAMDAYQNDCIVLLNEEPLYAYLLVGTRTVLSRAIPVAAVSMTDGDFVFYLNSEGYLSYTQKERLFILKHEWTHWIDEHPLQAVYFDPQLWNLACDISINQDLESAFAQRPKDAQMPEMYGLPPGLSPEAYYDSLKEMHEKGELAPHASVDFLTNRDKKPQAKDGEPHVIRGFITQKKQLSDAYFLLRIGTQTVVFSSTTEMQDEQGDDLSFDAIEPCSTHDENGKVYSFEEMADKPFAESLVVGADGGLVGLHLRLTEPNEEDERPQPGGNGKNDLTSLDDLHPDWKELGEASSHILKKQADDTLKNAMKQVGKDLPDGLKERFKSLLQTKTNWRGELSLFIASNRGQHKKYTYRKRNRRIPFAPGVKKNKQLKIVVIIDTSASVSPTELSIFDAEIRKMKRSMRDIDIVIMTCDSDVRDIFRYDRHMKESGITFEGRGGTDFHPPFTTILERKHALLRKRPDAVLYLTDGGGVAPDHFSIPTLWCLTSDGHRPYKDSFGSGHYIDWGRFIHLNE